jgi:hypothetical protein
MQEDRSVQSQELDQVLYDAQIRRSADLGLWLRQYFESRRRRRQQTEAVTSNTVTTLHLPTG